MLTASSFLTYAHLRYGNLLAWPCQKKKMYTADMAHLLQDIASINCFFLWSPNGHVFLKHSKNISFSLLIFHRFRRGFKQFFRCCPFIHVGPEVLTRREVVTSRYSCSGSPDHHRIVRNGKSTKTFIINVYSHTRVSLP
jgi:hypothetical protein